LNAVAYGCAPNVFLAIVDKFVNKWDFQEQKTQRVERVKAVNSVGYRAGQTADPRVPKQIQVLMETSGNEWNLDALD
jgi:hypothetical protein